MDLGLDLLVADRLGHQAQLVADLSHSLGHLGGALTGGVDEPGDLVGEAVEDISGGVQSRSIHGSTVYHERPLQEANARR